MPSLQTRHKTFMSVPWVRQAAEFDARRGLLSLLGLCFFVQPSEQFDPSESPITFDGAG